MFGCRACTIRCIRALAGDTFKDNGLHQQTRLFLTPRLTSRSLKRHLSSQAASKSNSFSHGEELIPADYSRSLDAVKAYREESKIDGKHLRLELSYLGDRVKFAEHIHYVLRCDQPEKALELCRLASKDQEVIVAWNHCVDWHMQRNKIDDAIAIYNEMKKRQQFPDSHTYVLLLRGLAKGSHNKMKGNVAKAMNIYNSLSSPNSRVEPGIIHTNAVLKVCNAALDLDAMWSVVPKLPTTGAGSPNEWTYTIILDTIRFGARDGNVQDMTPEQLAATRDKAVHEGRELWRDVIARWRSGEVKIDESLVSAMGKLLLTSRRLSDWDDVLNLVQQTMKIERLIPAVGDPKRNLQHVPNNAEAEQEYEPAEDSEGYKDSPTAKVFHAIQPHQPDPAHPNRPKTLAWVKPGNASLSLLLAACTHMRIASTATKYWNLYTTEYGVKPDLWNFHSRLILLAYNRASTAAANLLKEEMKAAGVEPKNQTLRIAMRVCHRDKNNPKALENARSVVDVMEATQVDPDIHVLIQYLSLALGTDDGTLIAGTLDRLDPIVHNLRSRLSFGPDDIVRTSAAQNIVYKDETITFLQTMVGTIDTLMNRGLVSRDDFQQWHARRSDLTQFIGRAKKRLEKERANIDTAAAERQLRAEAKEAGRALRRQQYEDQGKIEPRMSKDEWALKVFRNKEKRDGIREGNRQKAIGLTRWNVAQARGRIAGDRVMRMNER